MTKERKADLLLDAARFWQAEESREIPDEISDEVLFHTNGDLSGEATSAALSEVAGLGFDIVNSDGSDCEKVAEVDWPRSDDENRYIMRKVLK